MYFLQSRRVCKALIILAISVPKEVTLELMIDLMFIEAFSNLNSDEAKLVIAGFDQVNNFLSMLRL